MDSIHKKGFSPVAIAGLIIVGVLLFAASVQAANTNSIDLESGSSQSLSISDGSQSGLDVTGDMTIEAWVKPESQPSSDNYAIASKWQGSGSFSYLVTYSDDSGTKKLKMFNSSDGTNVSQASINHSLTSGVWHHVAFVYTASTGGLQVYVDGVSVGTTTGLATSMYNSAASFAIGQDENDDYFDGLMDEVRVWNTARNGGDIADDYSHELEGDESGLVGYWKLNGNLADSTSSSNTLSNNNSATFSSEVPFAEEMTLKARKSSDETVSNSTTIQDDDSLVLVLASDKSYIVDGMLFVAASSTGDIAINFTGPSGSVVVLGYEGGPLSRAVLTGGITSGRIVIPAPNTPIPLHISGTVQTTGSGDLQLRWAQATAVSGATAVQTGSYLRAEEI